MGTGSIQRRHATLDSLADLIVAEGGVQAVADAFTKSSGIPVRAGMITNREYEAAVSRLPRAGMLVCDARVGLARPRAP
jgi:hypothetical protein